MQYRPKTAFTVPLVVLTPTETKINGVVKKTYPNIEDGIRINASFKTYGGTETIVNNLLVVEDTAEIETFYRPDIKANCIIAIAGAGTKYEILGEPENINMANQFMKFKVRKIKGGA